MKKVLVTGAAGFIGFHLAAALKLRGDFVVGLDNYNKYYDPTLKRLRADILSRRGIEVVEGDICHNPILEDLVKRYAPTHICHLAAQAGVRYSIENPEAYVQSNIHGFLNILEVCRRHPHIPLCYASSSSVYGMNEKVPFSEEDRTDRQASLYGVTKKSNELMAVAYHHLFNIKVTGLRFFTVYGPWGRPDMAYYTFTDRTSKGLPIDLFNEGQMRRDFTYVDDIVQGVMKAIDLEADCEVFNLGNHRPETLGHFVEAIENAVGKKAVKRYLPMQAGDVVTTFADVSHAAEKLGFVPKTSLESGIPKFVRWYLEYEKMKKGEKTIAIDSWKISDF